MANRDQNVNLISDEAANTRECDLGVGLTMCFLIPNLRNGFIYPVMNSEELQASLQEGLFYILNSTRNKVK